MLDNKPIDIKLSIVIKNDDVIADVHFYNNSSNKVYLDSWTICLDNVLRKNIFSIAYDNDRRVVYSGMMVKRLVLPEDFIELKPGESIKTIITINKDYNLVKGKKYIIRYCASNPSYLGKQRLIDLLSNKVEITY
jgi:hypothetical protein